MAAEPKVSKDYRGDRDQNDKLVKYKYGPIDQNSINLK